MPTKPTNPIVSNVASQRSRRYDDTVYDQHKSKLFPNGRPWWGTREFAANQGQRDGFCSVLQPGDNHEDAEWPRVWQAPWMPDEVSSVHGGSTFEVDLFRMRLTIRYDRIINEDTRASDIYYDAAAKIAFEKSWAEIQYGSLPPHAVRAIIGNPPRSPRIAQAAQAGDPWLLGLSNEVNEELATLLGLSRKGLPAAYLKPVQPIVKPEEVAGMSGDALKTLIDAAVQAALEKDRASRAPKAAAPKKAPKPANTPEPSVATG